MVVGPDPDPEFVYSPDSNCSKGEEPDQKISKTFVVLALRSLYTRGEDPDPMVLWVRIRNLFSVRLRIAIKVKFWIRKS